MSTLTDTDTVDTLNDSIDRLEEHAWKLHTRLGGYYGSKDDQIQDMIALGRLAQRIADLRKARAILQDPYRLPTIRD